MLTALGKQQELKGQMRGTLNNGVTVQEFQEVLLHAEVYCGVPAAVNAFQSANEVISSQILIKSGCGPGKYCLCCYLMNSALCLLATQFFVGDDAVNALQRHYFQAVRRDMIAVTRSLNAGVFINRLYSGP